MPHCDIPYQGTLPPTGISEADRIAALNRWQIDNAGPLRFTLPAPAPSLWVSVTVTENEEADLRCFKALRELALKPGPTAINNVKEQPTP